MIERQLKLTGIFTGSVFLAGALLTFIMGLTSGENLATMMRHPSVIICTAVAALFYLSAFRTNFFWIQPVIFLLLTPIPIRQAPESLFGLGFFTFAMALLYRLGFFEKRKILKLILSLAYLLLCEMLSLVFSKAPITSVISVIFFIIAFLLFFYLMFQDKLMVFLSAPKEKLSLEQKGLSDAEIDYVRSIIAGKSVKEAAFDAGVSESTVRNMLARSYVKLGVTNRAGLSALAEKFDIVK